MQTQIDQEGVDAMNKQLNMYRSNYLFAKHSSITKHHSSGGGVGWGDI